MMASLFGYISVSLAPLATGIAGHCTRLHNCSSSIKLDGLCWPEESSSHATDSYNSVTRLYELEQSNLSSLLVGKEPAHQTHWIHTGLIT